MLTSALQSVGGAGTLPQEVSFEFDTASPLTIFNLLSNDLIDKSEVTITEPFDDPSATLELGTVANPDLIFSTSQIDAQAVGDYVCDKNIKITTNETMRLNINPGSSTQGKGFVLITIRR